MVTEYGFDKLVCSFYNCFILQRIWGVLLIGCVVVRIVCSVLKNRALF